MRTYLDCIPCFVKQTIDVAKFVTDDEILQERIIRDVLKFVYEMDMSKSPPEMGREIHKHIQKVTGIQDPYKDAKHFYNEYALKMYPELKERIKNSEDPFETAVRLSIAGNIIDFGAKTNLEPSNIGEAIEHSLSAPLDMEALEELKYSIRSANNILYLGDNSGEIVFDRLLLEEMPLEKITFVVKESPIINDALLEDAEQVGITELVNVIDNGGDVPGTLIEECSEDFQRRFKSADLIIAKGQGNYETMSEVPGNIFFLFKAKCSVISKHAGCELGSIVIKKSEVEVVME